MWACHKFSIDGVLAIAQFNNSVLSLYWGINVHILMRFWTFIQSICFFKNKLKQLLVAKDEENVHSIYLLNLKEEHMKILIITALIVIYLFVKIIVVLTFSSLFIIILKL